MKGITSIQKCHGNAFPHKQASVRLGCSQGEAVVVDILRGRAQFNYLGHRARDIIRAVILQCDWTAISQHKQFLSSER